MIADWFGLVCGLRFAVCGFCMAGLIRCGDLPMRKLSLLRSQLVVNTTRRSFKYGRRRHTTIVYPRFELRLLVNRESNR